MKDFALAHAHGNVHRVHIGMFGGAFVDLLLAHLEFVSCGFLKSHLLDTLDDELIHLTLAHGGDGVGDVGSGDFVHNFATAALFKPALMEAVAASMVLYAATATLPVLLSTTGVESGDLCNERVDVGSGVDV